MVHLEHIVNKLKKGKRILLQDGIKSFIISVSYFIYYRIISTNIFIIVYVVILYLYYQVKYGDAAPVPWETIYVDPKNINYLVTPRFRNVARYGTHIISGRWDQRICEHQLMLTSSFNQEFSDRRCIHPFKNYGLFQASKEHFVNGEPWEQTEFYEWLIRHPSEYSSHYKSKRFNNFDYLYNSIYANGYRSQKELNKDGNKIGISFSPIVPEDEILVNIGREGEIFLDDGRHRLIIAKLLQIDKIPVRVLVRHQEWQQKRIEMIKTEHREEYSEHPDNPTCTVSSLSD